MSPCQRQARLPRVIAAAATRATAGRHPAASSRISGGGEHDRTEGRHQQHGVHLAAAGVGPMSGGGAPSSVDNNRGDAGAGRRSRQHRDHATEEAAALLTSRHSWASLSGRRNSTTVGRPLAGSPAATIGAGMGSGPSSRNPTRCSAGRGRQGAPRAAGPRTAVRLSRLPRPPDQRSGPSGSELSAPPAGRSRRRALGAGRTCAEEGGGTTAARPRTEQ